MKQGLDAKNQIIRENLPNAQAKPERAKNSGHMKPEATTKDTKAQKSSRSKDQILPPAKRPKKKAKVNDKDCYVRIGISTIQYDHSVQLCIVNVLDNIHCGTSSILFKHY